MTTPRTMHLRMIIGVLALLGLLVAIYLALYENGLSSSLVCPNEGCDQVNTSDYVTLFSLFGREIHVADVGVVGYLTILVITLVRMTRRTLAGAIPLGWVLIGLSAIGFLFSLYLTYLELFRIGALCTWCAVSALLMTAIFVLTLLAWPAERVPRNTAAGRRPRH